MELIDCGGGVMRRTIDGLGGADGKPNTTLALSDQTLSAFSNLSVLCVPTPEHLLLPIVRHHVLIGRVHVGRLLTQEIAQYIPPVLAASSAVSAAHTVRNKTMVLLPEASFAMV